MIGRNHPMNAELKAWDLGTPRMIQGRMQMLVVLVSLFLSAAGVMFLNLIEIFWARTYPVLRTRTERFRADFRAWHLVSWGRLAKVFPYPK